MPGDWEATWQTSGFWQPHASLSLRRTRLGAGGEVLLLVLFVMGGLAAWAGSEAVLPAYLVGMVLAGTVGKDHVLIRRLRTLTFGLLTPFYFIRAGSFVSIPALIAAPATFSLLFLAKVGTKVVCPIPPRVGFATGRPTASTRPS